jgi:hypothetical protein
MTRTPTTEDDLHHEGVDEVHQLSAGTAALKRLPNGTRRALVAIIVLVALAACGGPGDEELRDGALSLIPPHSAILKERPGDCIELAPSPSCVRVHFVATQIGLERRTAAVIKTATESGWMLDGRELLPGGMDLRFNRGDLKAFVSLGTDDQAERCASNGTLQCADTVHVEGDYGV